jgi:hypothetical protein
MTTVRTVSSGVFGILPEVLWNGKANEEGRR